MGKRLILFYSILVIAGITLVVMIAYSKHSLVYDERHHIQQVALLNQYGLSKEFLLKLPSSPGPLYGLIHSVLSPLTLLQAPAIRLTSIFFLICTICALATILKQLKYPTPWNLAVLVMSLSPIYVVFGMALTEPYSIAFCSAAIALSIFGFRHNDAFGWIATIGSGIFWGLTLLGRQSYLPGLLALLFLIAWEYKLWIKVLVIVIMGTLPLCILISVWKGLVPPSVASVGKGFNLNNFILALAYSGLLLCILCPKWLLLGKRTFVLAVIGSVALNFCHPFISVVPMATIANCILKNKATVYLFRYAISVVFTGIALVTFLSFLYRTWERRNKEFYLYFAIAALGILFATVKITVQFSSRYVIMAAPFFVLLTAADIKFNRFLIFRVVIGATLGLVSLFSYLFLQP